MSDIKRSGDGTRPTTSGGVDNIGAGERFVPGGAPGHGGPAGEEGMTHKRSDAASTRKDDSVPLGLNEDPSREKI